MSNERDTKKWRPFNSVVPSRELLKRDIELEVPTLSKDEIMEFEEKLKTSMYQRHKIEITFIENNKLCKINDYVIKLDPLKKNIYLNSKIINFRQICNIK